MNDPCIVYEVAEVETFDELASSIKKVLVLSYFKKDKTSVDFLSRACILPYIEAVELYKSLSTHNDNIKMVTLKELLTENKYKDVLKMIINNRTI